MLVLTNSDVSTLLGSLKSSDILSILSVLALALGNSSINQPPRQAIQHPHPSCTTTLLMPTATPSAFSIKILSLEASPTSSQRTSPKGSIFLFSSDGSLDAVLNASAVTGFRTALACMIPFSIRFLPHVLPSQSSSSCAPPPLSEVLIFGAGLQAEWTIRLLLILCNHADIPLPKITIINRTLPRAQSLITTTTNWLASNPLSKFPVPDLQCTTNNTPSLKALLTTADAIFCCTPSHDPLFPASHLLVPVTPPKTRFISAIGSYKPAMKELDPDLLISPGGFGNCIMVDTREGCLVGAGEIIAAQQRKGEPLELYELGSEWKSGDWEKYRKNNVLYKSVGTGVMDLAVGQELVKLSRERLYGN
ncbi:hypothetical protein BDZ91DRAFT_714591 [Kalaharituber pfeilii]|nr:hypothetical protein BDZ91DRAFT_714591 [Kalaharituber pfeilii]